MNNIAMEIMNLLDEGRQVIIESEVFTGIMIGKENSYDENMEVFRIDEYWFEPNDNAWDPHTDDYVVSREDCIKLIEEKLKNYRRWFINQRICAE